VRGGGAKHQKLYLGMREGRKGRRKGERVDGDGDGEGATSSIGRSGPVAMERRATRHPRAPALAPALHASSFGGDLSIPVLPFSNAIM
jgi:hypothetical protein